MALRSSCRLAGRLLRRLGQALRLLPVAVLLWGCAVVGKDRAARECLEAVVRYGELVGKPVAEVDTAKLPKPLRIYAVGSLITGDHRPERLNIVIGVDGSVVGLRCG